MSTDITIWNGKQRFFLPHDSHFGSTIYLWILYADTHTFVFKLTSAHFFVLFHFILSPNRTNIAVYTALQCTVKYFHLDHIYTLPLWIEISNLTFLFIILHLKNEYWWCFSILFNMFSHGSYDFHQFTMIPNIHNRYRLAYTMCCCCCCVRSLSKGNQQCNV